MYIDLIAEKTPSRPEGNANWCNSTNLAVKTRVERYKAGIANPPDNKSTLDKRTLFNNSFTWRMTTRLGVVTHTHYGFMACDLAGNCSPTETFRCTPNICKLQKIK